MLSLTTRIASFGINSRRSCFSNSQSAGVNRRCSAFANDIVFHSARNRGMVSAVAGAWPRTLAANCSVASCDVSSLMFSGVASTGEASAMLTTRVVAESSQPPIVIVIVSCTPSSVRTILAQITPRDEAQELQFGLIGSMNAAAKTAATLIRSAVASVLYVGRVIRL